MRAGLTLGKFAPFHRGHEYLINVAYDRLNPAFLEVCPLYVVLYDDEYYNEIPLQTRADWIRKCPSLKGKDIRVIIGYNSPNDVGNSEEIQRIQENYLLKTLGLEDYGITHFFSSESYGEHIAKAFGCEDVRIDMSRSNVNISGTELRNDTYGNRNFLRPHVYKDLIEVLTFMGGPGSGKSTLIEALAKDLNESFCLEYGREFWEKNNVDRRLSPDQMEEICLGHILREDQAIIQARNVCFIDTNPITTLLFNMYYHGSATPFVNALAEMSISRYSRFIVCDSDFDFIETEDRSGDVNRKLFQKMTLDYLDHKKIKYYLIGGSLENRVRTVKQLLLLWS